MKKIKILILAMTFFTLVAGTARAEMYGEVYGGMVQGANTPKNITIIDPPTDRDTMSNPIPGRLDPAFHGGLKFGAWFDKSGVLSGINFPAWMKYLGFYLDFSYHRLIFPSPDNQGIANLRAVIGGVGSKPFQFWSKGTAATLAFMLACRYGFLPDGEVPFGRLQPYVAAGPAILFSSQQPAIKGRCVHNAPYAFEWESESSVDICMAVEAGLRWMVLRNVALDVSFKYRYANPAYTYSYRVPFSLVTTESFTWKPDYKLFSLQVGVAYHF